MLLQLYHCLYNVCLLSLLFIVYRTTLYDSYIAVNIGNAVSSIQIIINLFDVVVTWCKMFTKQLTILSDIIR